MPGCLAANQTKPAKSTRPNILFLFTDDQRFDTIRALGNKQIVTPSLDTLVREGTTFTNAYIMGSNSGAVCVPSRAMLLTGRNLFDLEKDGSTIPAEHPTLPQILSREGYVTFGTGKWHNKPDSFARSFTAGGHIFFGGMHDHNSVPVYDFDPTGQYARGSEHKHEGMHSSELFTNSAIEFLHNYNVEKPFFVYVAYTSPHDPRTAPKKYQDMYNPEKIPLPGNFMPEHPFDNGEMRIRDEKLAPWPRTPEEIRRHIADYYAMITHTDAQIARVLAALEQTGRKDNTIIIFAGDNGLAVGQHGLMGKQNLYEHSIHVPLIMSGPGIQKNQKRTAFCYLQDIYPTLCELAGLAVPDTVKSKSLVPVLQAKKAKIRDSLFFAYKDYQRAVRDKRYKLIEYAIGGNRTTQLFDLQADTLEISNLAAELRHYPDVDRLRKELLRYKYELGDSGKFWEGLRW